MFTSVAHYDFTHYSSHPGTDAYPDIGVFDGGMAGQRHPWEEGNIVVYCDVCGSHVPALPDVSSDSSLASWGYWHAPIGWHDLGNNLHICPDCASSGLQTCEESSVQVRFEYDDAADGAGRVLNKEEARQLSADEQGVLHVPDGVCGIGPKAFMYCKGVREIVLPASVNFASDYAFSCSTIERFIAPPNLRYLGKKAFYHCDALEEVVLNDALEYIDEEAFSHTPLASLRLPAGVKAVGKSFIAATPLADGARETTFSIDEANQTYRFDDESGALYAYTPEGLCLQALLRPCETLVVSNQARAILPYACQGMRTLQTIVLPEGLKSIGRGAFSDCSALTNFVLPESLEALGSEALSNTAIQSLRIPASLRYLGTQALAISTARQRTSLRAVEVEQGNPRFYVQDELLMQHAKDGTASVLLSFGAQSQVVVPSDVSSIAPYAITSLQSGEVRLSQTLSSIHPHAFESFPRVLVRIDLPHEIEGRSYALVRNPSRRILVLATFTGSFDVARMFELRDGEVLGANSLLEDVMYALDRLECPQYLSAEARQFFIMSLTSSIMPIVMDFVEHGQIHDLYRLADVGVLTEDNISDVIDKVSQGGNVAVIGSLLDIKNQCFGMERIDFSL